MTPDAPSKRTPRAWVVALGAAAAIVSLAVGGTLGLWQWDRAHRQTKAVDPEPRAPIAQVMKPAAAGTGEGRLVSVEGTWAVEDVALIAGKVVEGDDAVLLIRPFTVPAGETGTGQQATLAVLSGWLPADADLPLPTPGEGESHLEGYIRGGEAAAAAPARDDIAGALWEGSMSTASLANAWPAPVYSYLLVADDPAPGWNPMPPPKAGTTLDVRSVTYSIEWWLFGAFGAYISWRLVRDNMKTRRASEAS